MSYSRKLELETIRKMILIYCGDMHGGDKKHLCPQCQELFQYACERMDRCIYGDNKPVCSQCPVHCYKPAMREAVRKVMRYSGPRMMWNSPLLTLRYMYRKKFRSYL